MSMKLNDVLQALNEGQAVDRADVKPADLGRIVYTAGWNMPGYLLDNPPSVFKSKRQALASLWEDWFRHTERTRAPAGYRQSYDLPPDDDDYSYFIDSVPLSELL